jgi:hypothetical protein
MSTKLHSITIIEECNQTFNVMRVSELSKRTACLLATGKADMDGERKIFLNFCSGPP